jgi:hypothetical protein
LTTNIGKTPENDSLWNRMRLPGSGSFDPSSDIAGDLSLADAQDCYFIKCARQPEYSIPGIP